MLRILLAIVTALGGLATGPWLFAAPGAAAAVACADLTRLTIPAVAISSAEAVPAGPFTPQGGGRGAGTTVPAFCRVRAVATPTPDSHINIEVWVPAAGAWNGKLLGTANGGFAGAIGFGAMASGLAKGYAVAGTDTGHTGDQLEFAQGHPEKVIDWGHRAIHLMTDVAKLVVRNHHGRFPEYSYFEGCSTGGQQALSEVQRYPDDYDGVVAGDPGHNRIRLILGFLWGWSALHTDTGQSLLSPANLSLLTRAVVEACDARDGLRDGLIDDPRTCTFKPATLLCKDAENESCLTGAQVAAVEKVYEGARHKRTGEQLFPGWIRGSEQGWGQYLTNPREPVRVGFFRAIAFGDPAWDFRSFDWDRDVAFVDRHAPVMSALSRDLRAFKARNGKLLMYTGWADPVVPPQDTVAYYEDVARTMGGMASIQSFFRFFPVAGMGHCGGGPGPSTFDALGALEQWVERGVAPAHLVGSRTANGATVQTRPICAYPQVAKYRGTGSRDTAASFTCAAPVPVPGRATPPAAAR